MLYGLEDIAMELVARESRPGLRRDEFWALKDVSFQLHKGESLGLIGHNGAGKTTTLKIINGLIKPNAGRISVTGDVRALISLGTGFNPVLTGRENIWIASAVLGHDKDHTAKNFDEIVEFSEIGEFIDAPVQTYSSGMLARLGFAVAVHTRPEILLIDEVLAVGDLNFALKCLRKIQEFKEHGGSIIFVSHSQLMIRANCDKVLWIEKGCMQKIGDSGEICTEYEAYVSSKDVKSKSYHSLYDSLGIESCRCSETIDSGGMFTAEFIVKSGMKIEHPIFFFHIFSIQGQLIVMNMIDEDSGLKINPGLNKVTVKYPCLPFAKGTYNISIVISEKEIMNQILAFLNCLKFTVNGQPGLFDAGLLRINPDWELAFTDGHVA